MLLCTLSSKILLHLLKGPPPQTHSENDEVKPHTQKAQSHQSQSPRSGWFLESTPTSRFHVRDLEQISHLQKIKLFWIRSSSSPYAASKMLTYYFIIQRTASFISKWLLKACQIYRHECIKNFNWTTHVLTYSTYSSLNSERAETHLRETPQVGRQAQESPWDTWVQNRDQPHTEYLEFKWWQGRPPLPTF